MLLKRGVLISVPSAQCYQYDYLVGRQRHRRDFSTEHVYLLLFLSGRENFQAKEGDGGELIPRRPRARVWVLEEGIA